MFPWNVYTCNAPYHRSRVEVFCYALSPSDGSEWRLRIESETEHFLDVSSWSVADIARRISADGVHVAVNLNGYTKGARNEIFALWPAPVQTSYMGFPATTGVCVCVVCMHVCGVMSGFPATTGACMCDVCAGGFLTVLVLGF